MVKGTISGLLCGAFLALAAFAGDKDVAEFLCTKAEKELRARAYEDALSDFKRAREEVTPFPAAAYGLGVALEKLEREIEAITAYRTCIAEVEAAENAPLKWKQYARRSASAIKRLRRQYADLDKLTRDCIEECLEFARANLKANPRWARAAYETVLKLDPANSDAKRGLKRIPETAPAPAAAKKTDPQAPKGLPLIRTSDLPEWTPGVRGPWTCADGIVTCSGEGRTGHINWHDRIDLRGKYELRAKARIVKHRNEGHMIGFFLGDGKDEWYAALLDSDGELVLIHTKGDRNTDVATGRTRNLDPSKWHTWRLVVDDDDIEVFIGGQKVLEYRAPDGIGGKPAVFAQRARVEFKEVEVVK